jgi:hypothetical protein
MSRVANRWALIVFAAAGLFAAVYADIATATAESFSPGDSCADVAQLASFAGPGLEEALPGAVSALADSPAGPIVGAGLAGTAGAVPAAGALLPPDGPAGLPLAPIASLAAPPGSSAPLTQAAGDAPASAGAPLAEGAVPSPIAASAPAGGAPTSGVVPAAPVDKEAGIVSPTVAAGVPAGGTSPAAGGIPTSEETPFADLPLQALPRLAELLCCP